MVTTAAIARNIRLIVDTIITSHTGIAYHAAVSRFHLLISVECAPECIVLGIMSGEHWRCLPNRTVYGPVVEISASVKKNRFLRSQVILNYELKIVCNCLEQVAISLMHHCKFINKFVLFQQKIAVGS